MLQAGTIPLLGLATNHLTALRALAGETQSNAPTPTAKSVIFVFLSGGLGQHDSFDPKPDAPAGIRGEFGTIATKTPGLQICEHLPKLAERSQKWALCRSLTHPQTSHSHGHHIMLTGRTELPIGFDPNKPKPSDIFTAQFLPAREQRLVK